MPDVVMNVEAAERAELAECLRVIQDGEQTFIRVGESLRTVQHKRLFRYTHEDFKGWCKEHLPWSFRRAQQLMDASITGKALMQTCAPKTNNLFVGVPVNEGIVRELQVLDPPKREAAFQLALDSGAKRVTAKVVKEAVREVQRRITPPAVPVPPPPPGTVRPEVQAALDRAGEFDFLLAKLAEFRQAAEKLWSDATVGMFLNPHEVESFVDGLKRLVRFAKPYADCVYCEQVGCTECRSCGWLPKDKYDAAPSEVRERSVVRR